MKIAITLVFSGSCNIFLKDSLKNRKLKSAFIWNYEYYVTNVFNSTFDLFNPSLPNKNNFEQKYRYQSNWSVIQLFVTVNTNVFSNHLNIIYRHLKHNVTRVQCSRNCMSHSQASHARLACQNPTCSANSCAEAFHCKHWLCSL